MRNTHGGQRELREALGAGEQARSRNAEAPPGGKRTTLIALTCKTDYLSVLR